jgi:hypothetical protein
MEQIVFTRYLYPMVDVKQSLLLSLLDKNSNEALFWSYELFHSGFEENTFEYIYSIYEMFYQCENPDIHNFMQHHCKLSSRDVNVAHYIGSVILTLCGRDYQIYNFLKTYLDQKCRSRVNKKRDKSLIIQLNPTDMKQYETQPIPYGKNRHYLKEVCKYPIRKEFNEFFGTTCIDLQNYFDNNWLYFASKSPIWSERIEKYGGVECEDSIEIIFDEESGRFDAFHDLWNLCTDEQPIEIKIRCIGNCNIKQLSMDDFIEKYSGIEELTNSITYM